MTDAQPQTNGLDSGPPQPGWMEVDPEAVVQQLTAQLAGMIQQLAMRDAYIARLHQALAAAGEASATQSAPT